jgi:hypothetical protein
VADPPDEELEEAVAVEVLPEDDDELAVVAPDPESVGAVDVSEAADSLADSPEDWVEDSEEVSVEAVSPPDSLEEDSPEEAISPADALSPPEALSLPPDAEAEDEPLLPGPAEPKEPLDVVVVVFLIVRL